MHAEWLDDILTSSLEESQPPVSPAEYTCVRPVDCGSLQPGTSKHTSKHTIFIKRCTKQSDQRTYQQNATGDCIDLQPKLPTQPQHRPGAAQHQYATISSETGFIPCRRLSHVGDFFLLRPRSDMTETSTAAVFRTRPPRRLMKH